MANPELEAAQAEMRERMARQACRSRSGVADVASTEEKLPEASSVKQLTIKQQKLIAREERKAQKLAAKQAAAREFAEKTKKLLRSRHHIDTLIGRMELSVSIKGAPGDACVVVDARHPLADISIPFQVETRWNKHKCLSPSDDITFSPKHSDHNYRSEEQQAILMDLFVDIITVWLAWEDSELPLGDITKKRVQIFCGDSEGAKSHIMETPIGRFHVRINQAYEFPDGVSHRHGRGRLVLETAFVIKIDFLTYFGSLTMNWTIDETWNLTRPQYIHSGDKLYMPHQNGRVRKITVHPKIRNDAEFIVRGVTLAWAESWPGRDAIQKAVDEVKRQQRPPVMSTTAGQPN